jgi:hypothetical protein
LRKSEFRQSKYRTLFVARLNALAKATRFFLRAFSAYLIVPNMNRNGPEKGSDPLSMDFVKPGAVEVVWADIPDQQNLRI